MSSVTSPDPEVKQAKAARNANDEEQNARLAAEIEKSERLATSQLHMAEWFLAQGRTEIAKRRLELLVETLPRSSAAQRAATILQDL